MLVGKATAVRTAGWGFVAKVFLAGCLSAGALTVACGESATPTSFGEAASVAPAVAFGQGVAQSVETASYRIEVVIWPAITTIGTEEGVTTMAQMALISPIDQGQPVNHHLKVHIYDKSTRVLVEDMTPAVKITDQATGSPTAPTPSRSLSVMTRPLPRISW